MAVDGTLRFDTKIDTDGFKSGTNTIKTQANGLKGMLLGLGKAMIVAFSVTALVSFGKQAISIASDLREVQNVVDTAFGDMAYKMEEFAATSIESFGMSKLAAKQAGSTYMAMASNMISSRKAAADMATTLTGLTGDWSSFYNVSQGESQTALNSIFTGETEAMKRYGVVMTQVNLEEFARQRGINKSITAMTQEEQVLLRYNYVMAKSAMVQGDFAKTSGSWANQTRVLSEQWKEFLGILGQGLIQVLVPIVRFLNTAMASLISFANMAGKVLSSVFGIEQAAIGTAKATTAIGTGADDASSGLSDMGKSTKKAAKEAKKGTSSFDVLNNMTGDVADNAESAADSMAMMGGGGAYGMDITPTVKAADTTALESGLTTAIENIKTGLSIFLAYLNTSFGPIFSSIWTNLQLPIQTFKTIVAGIFTDLQTLGQPLIEYFVGYLVPGWQTVFTTLGDIAVGLFDTFNMIFSDIWNLAIFPILENFISVGLPMFAEFATLTWETLGVLFDTVKSIFDMLWTDAVAPVIGFISQVWIDLMNTFADFWNKWGSPIFEGLKTAIQTTGDLFKTIWDTILKPVFDTFMKVADELWTDHLQPLLANFLDLVGEMASGALAIYNKFIAPLVKWFVEKLGPPIAKIISGIIEQMGEWIGSTLDVISNLIKSFKGIIEFLTGVFTGDWEKAWQGIQDIFTGIFESLVIIIKPIINGIIDIINGMIGGIVAGINTVIRSVNSLSFDIPETAFTKAYHVGFNLREFSAQKIPRLATGTVIPPNSEFLAILGDQKRGTNIEAPLDTIVAAFKAVTSQNNGGTSGSNMAHFTIKVGNRVLFDGVVEAEKENYSITGKPIFVH